MSRLGAGGMGEVFRARDTRLDRSVAIKVLPAAFASDAELKLRFDREARTVSRLSHPHICTLYDVGDQDGVAFLVMELLEGETLSSRLARGPMPLRDVLRYGAQIASALARAHRHGVVHRDLKPANVMVTKSGAKLLDFGLARSAAGNAGEGGREAETLTRRGALVGTVAYMAPEQLESRQADARSDVYALGAVLYEMASGRRVFDGRTPTPVVSDASSAPLPVEPPRATAGPAAVAGRETLQPPALEHLVALCLQRDPEERWQSAFDVAEHLRFIGETLDEPAARPARHRAGWGLVAAVALLAGLAGGAIAARSAKPATAYRFTIPARTSEYTRAYSFVLAPDGTRVAFEATNGRGQRQIFVQSLRAFGARALAGTEGGQFHAWSPDGEWIAFSAGRKLQRLRIAGGSPEKLADLPDFAILTQGTWSAAGDILIGEVFGELLHLAPGASALVPFARPRAELHEKGYVGPTFLPDGRRFLVTTYVEDPVRGHEGKSLYVGEIGQEGLRRLQPSTSQVKYSRGRLFWRRDGTLLAAPFDLRTLQVTAEPEVVAENVDGFGPSGHAAFDVSSDGTLVFKPRFAPVQLTLVDGTGHTLRTLGKPTRQPSGMTLTNDGAVVAALWDEATQLSDVWAFGLDRPTASRLTATSGFVSTPVVSPDGTTLYYSRQEGRANTIYRRSLRTGEAEVALHPPGIPEQFATSISPDGLALLYQYRAANSPGDTDVYVMPTSGGEPRPFVAEPANETAARFSPDGRSVLYVSDATGRYEAYVRPFRGPSAPRQVTTDGSEVAAWRQDGRAIFWARGRQVWETEIEGGHPGRTRHVFALEDEVADLLATPDGRFVVALLDEDAASQPAHVVVPGPDNIR